MPGFDDTDFLLVNHADPTKLVFFDAGSGTTGTTIFVSFPGVTTKLAGLAQDQVFSAFNVFTGNLAFGPSNILNYTFDGSNAAGLLERIIIPAVSGGVDTMAVLGVAQTFTKQQTILPDTDVVALSVYQQSGGGAGSHILNAYDTDGTLVAYIAGTGAVTAQGINVLNSSHTGLFSPATLSADRTWTFPNATGTVSLIANTETLTNKTITRLTTGTTIKGLPTIAGDNTGASAANLMLRINATNQDADIASANLTNTVPAGFYRVSYVLEDTTADATAGIVTLTLGWTDDAGATTTTATQTLATAGRSSGSVVLYLASGDVSYATTHTGIFGTSKYALRIRIEYLG